MYITARTGVARTGVARTGVAHTGVARTGVICYIDSQYSQGPKSFPITVNTTMKMDSPLKNGIHFRKWNFNEKFIFHH